MDTKIEEQKPVDIVIKEEKAAIEKMNSIKEKIAARECDICDILISVEGMSPEPGVCKSCYGKMVRGEKLDG